MQGETTLTVVEVFVGLVAAAGLIGLLARRIAVPYTVALVTFGLAAAIFAPQINFAITEELVLVVLLPGLIFEASYNLDVFELRRAFGGVTLLAVPGVIISAVVVAGLLAIATDIPFELGFVIGAMVAATDPAAVISTFRQLGSPKRLATMVEGESLFNDGTALVVFAIALRVVVSDVTPLEAVGVFVVTVVVSAVIGGVIGFVASRIVATVDDHLLELTISLAAAYGGYLIADLLHESGIIATVVAGLVLGNYGRRIGMSERTQDALNTVWEFIAFLLTALVFLLVGLVISFPALVEALWPIVWGVVAIMIGRALVVYLLLGGTSRLVSDRYHPAVPLAWLHVMFWSGLRGAVAVAMALSLPADFPQRLLLQEVTFGIVLFTLAVQGTTIGLVIRRTGAGQATTPDQAP
ncbi:MAG TPA: cation:proton antiporter [Candidatus Limnocylindrales bacterium]|nr:cation:proton antiporter [Candidatus Limnocylindrales bacterium]